MHIFNTVKNKCTFLILFITSRQKLLTFFTTLGRRRKITFTEDDITEDPFTIFHAAVAIGLHIF